MIQKTSQLETLVPLLYSRTVQLKIALKIFGSVTIMQLKNQSSLHLVFSMLTEISDYNNVNNEQQSNNYI